MSDQWMVRGVEFSNCNCSYGYQFNAPSTNGFCEAIASGHIEEGYCNDTRLDGLNFMMGASKNQAFFVRAKEAARGKPECMGEYMRM